MAASGTEMRRGGRAPFAALCALSAAAALPLLLAGCRQDMHDQPKYKTFTRSDFFGDERSARPLVEDTVARGHLKDDPLLYTGKAGADFADEFPLPMGTRGERAAVLARGRDRFQIFCSPCHGLVGRGDGMVVRRGFKKVPPSFHEQRLRAKPAGYFFDVMTSGFGAMQDYSAQIGVEDRWAIVAYIRALQLSENARIEDVPPEQRGALEAAKEKR